MMDRAEAAGMTIDLHVVGRIGEDHRGAFLAHQRGESGEIQGIAAQHAMATELPQIPDLADRRAGRTLRGRYRQDPSSGSGRSSSEAIRRSISPISKPVTSRLKSSPSEREVLELLRQQPVIPVRDLGQPVIGDHEGAGLRGREMIEA